MPTAFVAGATGYTGREVVRALARHRVTTIAHVRPDSARLEAVRRELAPLAVTVDTTPWEPALLGDTLSRVRPDFVFALLGTTRKRQRAAAREGRAPSTYESVDEGLTRMLLDAAVASGSRPRFVYLSALGADRTPGAYYDARRHVEAAIRESGLPALIARPSFITGDDRQESRPAERFFSRVADGTLSVVGALGASNLRDRYSSMNARELGTALVELSLSATSPVLIVETDALRRAAAASSS